MREALDALPQLNIFKMLAHADTAFIPYLRLGGALLAQLELDPKLRELVILLVAKHTGAEYEWIQHAAIARALGIPDEQITAIENGELQDPSLHPSVRKPCSASPTRYYKNHAPTTTPSPPSNKSSHRARSSSYYS